MAENNDELRQAIREDIQTDLAARKLVKAAVARTDPILADKAERLSEAVRAIPIAEKLRGESDAARAAALEALDELEKAKRG